jgi:hypothetical protein
MSGGGARASQRPFRQFVDKRKANELASSGNLSEPANRRWVRASTCDFVGQGELAAVGSWQLGSLEGGATHVAASARPVISFQPSGSLKPTAMGSDLSEPGACLATCPGL